MKKEGHPEYQEVLFIDTSTGTKFICGTTLKVKETETFEGKEYPVHRVPISSASHPFFTGSKQFVDTEGRVDKFRKRYATKKKEAGEQQAKEEEQKTPAKKKAARKTTKKKT
ncbi:MAG: 50S ribosomal protein L31 type B [Chlamydiae bacterium]|nr:50S ribosomal protein L31 type B [Chlamydiota bacterium]